MTVVIPTWYELWRKKRNDSDGDKKAGGGGGGKAKNKIGRTGPRGRQFPSVKTPGQRTVIVKGQYVKNDSDAKRHLFKWLEYCVYEKTKDAGDKEKGDDSRGNSWTLSADKLREKEFFTAHREEISFIEAHRLIRDNPGENVAFHQLILSSGHHQVEPKAFARDQMAALEEQLGHKLTWVANIHRDTGPDKMHINVTIAGRIPDVEQLRAERRDRLEPLELPPGYKIDYDRVQANDKVTGADGQLYSKFDSVERLREFSEFCSRRSKNHLPRDDYQRLWRWIGTKEQHGENCYGKPPIKRLDYEVDLDQIPKEEKINFNDCIFSKYNSLKQLEELERLLQNSDAPKLSEEQSDRLRYWIETKEKNGEEVFGSPPLKEIEPEKEPPPAKPKEPAIDLSKIPIEQTVQPLGKAYTKFHSLEELEKIDSWLEDHPEIKMADGKRDLLQGWIELKHEYGEDFFGKPPLLANVLDSYQKIDYDSISKYDKLNLHGTMYTKYDRLQKLEKLYDVIDSFKAPEKGIDRSEEALEKLNRWILNKLAYGDGFEGKPPTKEISTEGKAKIDLDKLPESQKVEIGDVTYTKFHPRADLALGLEALNAKLEKSAADLEKFGETYANFKQFPQDKQRIVKSEYQELKAEKSLLEEQQIKLKFWDYLKETHGDDVFGKPPLKLYEINYQKIAKEERIKVGTEISTKYDSVTRLQEAVDLAYGNPKVSDDQRQLLKQWLDTKLELGEDAYGQPPLKEVTRRFERDYSLIQDATDRGSAELLDDRAISPQGAKLQADFNRMDRIKDWHEKQEIMRKTANERGDVFITRNAFEAMRDKGNAYVNFQINLDKTLEQEFEKAFAERGLELEKNFYKEPDLDLALNSQASLEVEVEAEFEREFDRLAGRFEEGRAKGDNDQGKELGQTEQAHETIESMRKAVDDHEADEEREDEDPDPFGAGT